MLGTVMRIVAPKGGIPIMGRYISAFWRELELLDPDEPIKSMTRVFARWPINYPTFAKRHIMEFSEEEEKKYASLQAEYLGLLKQQDKLLSGYVEELG